MVFFDTANRDTVYSDTAGILKFDKAVHAVRIMAMVAENRDHDEMFPIPLSPARSPGTLGPGLSNNMVWYTYYLLAGKCRCSSNCSQHDAG